MTDQAQYAITPPTRKRPSRLRFMRHWIVTPMAQTMSKNHIHAVMLVSFINSRANPLSGPAIQF